ncbi:formate dehydrogenase delta subunit [Methylobacillus rhizosphaerae]|uniref:Formate dehydrogenase delta subunit n=1 Tax=Methylobacillus rhizosphaerae TaxID=551994 RepID=A0A239AE04_9PROT|nr:formate dehydrogenase subunit delta [Methylobacillus rhizosphaerae]SNR93887.1 formate dehydrogenase delta subunit [Methylobacillus rhizosphaerae]
MNIEHLVTMANQIGDFFRSYPDQEQARKDIASHLMKFWPPQMRQQIIQYMQDTPDNGLHPIVRSAIQEYMY